MNEQQIEKLISLGGKEWKKGTHHRIYFDAASLAPFYGLEILRYGTGNISSASLNGEKISNTSAAKIFRMLEVKLHYDVISQKWGFSAYSLQSDKLVETLIEKITERIGA